MKIGYARVSTQDQKLELQTDDLTKHGCEQIFKEKMSGKSKDRPELARMLEQLRAGDTVVVWKLDRLGRSLIDLVNLIEGFKERGVDFVSLQDNIDTSTPNGRLVFHFIAGLAEFEREVIRQRTRAGLAAAKARGRVGGRPAGLSKEALEKARSAKILHEAGGKSVGEIAKILGIGRATCYRYLSQVTEGEK